MRAVRAPQRAPATKTAPVQVRHKPPQQLKYVAFIDVCAHVRREPRPLILALSHMTSNVNFSSVVRTASSLGVTHIVAAGNSALVEKVARDPAHENLVKIILTSIVHHRSLAPVLSNLKSAGFHIVALEQTSESVPLPKFTFPPRTVLIVGNERSGVSDELLRLAETCVEIPIYQKPFSFNVAAAAAMAMYEYCRQHPA